MLLFFHLAQIERIIRLFVSRLWQKRERDLL